MSGGEVREGRKDDHPGGAGSSEGSGNLEVSAPVDLALERPLTGGPFLVKVDRYGSVSGLVRVRVPLGFVVLEYSDVGGSFGS